MRASRITLLAALGALALAACGRSNEQPAAPPPAAALDVKRPLNALGTEPFWSLKIRPEGLSYSDVEIPMIEAPDPVFEPEGAGASWTAAVQDGRRLAVHLEAKVCSGLAGLSYPFTAQLTLGTKAMTGCAAYADEMPKPGG